jgi:aconitate hydratase
MKHANLQTSQGEVRYFPISQVDDLGWGNTSKLPYSIRVLLEAALRNCDDYIVTENDVKNIASWSGSNLPEVEIPFMPGRVVLQDFTGVPAVVDLAALRNAMVRIGGDPKKINPLVQCDLVIDHSVQVDEFASKFSFQSNIDKEFERNLERYQFLRWGQQAFNNFRVVPPATGIVHQVNLEYLATVVLRKEGVVYPDSLVGTDSHTTMINGLGVVGWGVGGIEAEAVMLGQPIAMLLPEVVGFKLTGRLNEGTTATDMVLTITQMLRMHKVVGKFVEFYGDGLDHMSLADRATIANMAPEYGATIGFFPVDNETLNYLNRTGRQPDVVELVEKYYKAQGLFRTKDSPEPEFTSSLELDLSNVVPSLAGPKRPQDRIELKNMKSQWDFDRVSTFNKPTRTTADVSDNGHSTTITDGAVVIAAITSCTNTSNPSVMIAAGLVAKKAAQRGLTRKPWVKTSLAPGSRVVTEYLDKADLSRYLDDVGFNLVGYGCTTCIGNSGPLPEPVSQAVASGDLIAAAVLSGNRNFEGRINPQVKANYLASPPLVVAYAIAGTVDIDLSHDSLGVDTNGNNVYLKDIWPTQQEVIDTMAMAITPEMFQEQYGIATLGPKEWQEISGAEGEIYDWQENSTYVQEPPFFINMPPIPGPIQSIEGARVLALLGDSVTTDHISPAGSFKKDTPAGKYLIEQGVQPVDFNSYGARRGNDRVMTRGTFANIRLKNKLVPGVEGGFTIDHATGQKTTIYEAAMKYKEAGTPLMIIAGSEYGTGSSRDWAAKGTFLLGVKAVIAKSFERIHRSNLVGMGVLPLEFRPGEDADTLGLDGTETYDIELNDELKARQAVEVVARKPDGSVIMFVVTCRIDTPVEVDYYRNGGILHKVLRDLAGIGK